MVERKLELQPRRLSLETSSAKRQSVRTNTSITTTAPVPSARSVRGHPAPAPAISMAPRGGARPGGAPHCGAGCSREGKARGCVRWTAPPVATRAGFRPRGWRWSPSVRGGTRRVVAVRRQPSGRKRSRERETEFPRVASRRTRARAGRAPREDAGGVRHAQRADRVAVPSPRCSAWTPGSAYSPAGGDRRGGTAAAAAAPSSPPFVLPALCARRTTCFCTAAWRCAWARCGTRARAGGLPSQSRRRRGPGGSSPASRFPRSCSART